jgi:high affinity Mn2+ porin
MFVTLRHRSVPVYQRSEHRLDSALKLKWRIGSLAAASFCAFAAFAADEPVADIPPPQNFAVHGQFTYVEQETSKFDAPYRGPNSLSPGIGDETTDVTLYLGVKPWNGAQLWINGEIDQGFGLDDTLGAAGFPSGEAYKVGKKQPYFRLPRAFLRQNIDLGGESQADTAAANQLAGSHRADHLVIWLGKLSVGDIFDTNRYAHDPRSDFLNWAAIDAGTFDYAADAWGYTVGAAIEWYQGDWATRGGLFDLSTVPNSPHLDPGFHEFQSVLEVEHRHELLGASGRVLLTAFDSRGRMGLLDQAVQVAQSSGTPVDIAAVRAYRGRAGVSLGVEQEIVRDLGAFARIGKAGGNTEAYEFTDIDRTVSAGISLQGTRWHRADDTFGLAGINNAISASRENFLNAGGLGILVGDGRLPHPGPERILETYYSASLWQLAHLSFDYQWIDHPAYNRDRGPASVFAVRLHAQF